MQFTSIAIVLASHGSEGHLIYLGSPTAEATSNTGRDLRKAQDIQERDLSCLTRGISCSTSHAARNSNCDELVTELGGDSQTQLVSDTRQICYKGDSAKNEKCCLTVSQTISRLTKGDVVNSATTMLSTCTEEGISGKMINVLLKQTCASVCLSNHKAFCF